MGDSTERFMLSFRADVVASFEAASLESAGRELRRLVEAARSAGFELEIGRVESGDGPRAREGWTGYGPLDPDEAP